MTTRTLCTDLPAAEPGSTVRLQGWVHRRRELAQLTFLVVRDRTGLAQVVVRGEAREVPPEETPVEVVGTATANTQAPGGIEVTEPTIRAALRRRRHPARRAVAADPERRPADAARPRRRHLAAPAAARQVGAGRGQHARLPRHPRRGRASPRSPRPSWSSRPPRAAPTSSRSTTSAGRRTSPRARSSTSRCWSGSSSASTRSGRCSAPSRTTRSGTWRSTSASTSSSASSRTTARSSRACATWWPAWSRRCASTPPPRSSGSASPCRTCPRRSRSSTSATR